MESSPSTPETRTPSSDRAPLVALLLAIAVPAATTAWWLVPRPAEPAELPPMIVPQRDAEAALEAFDTLAHRGEDDSTERARQLELYRAQGLAELRASDSPGTAGTRAEELSALARGFETSGTLDAIRASDVERGMHLFLEPTIGTSQERAGELGSFPFVLQRYGAVVEGRRVAPTIVLHALFAARWNAIHGRPLTEGLSTPMLRAYHGWLVFYGARGGTDLRSTALVSYVEAGGLRGLETEGYLRLESGDLNGARAAFDAAYEASGNVRLRNHALAVSMSDGEGADEVEAP